MIDRDEFLKRIVYYSPVSLADWIDLQISAAVAADRDGIVNLCRG